VNLSRDAARFLITLVQLSRYATVTNTDGFIRATLRQLDAHLHGKTWLSGNWGVSALILRLEACGRVVELEDPRGALQ
jgi:hypothetical protein